MGVRQVDGELLGRGDGVAVSFGPTFRGYAHPNVADVSRVRVVAGGVDRALIEGTDYTIGDGWRITLTAPPDVGATLLWDGAVAWTDRAQLLPTNAGPQERALADAIGRDVPTPLRSLWNPDTCPAALLPWLAWALSIDAWKAYWPEHVKRARVRAAIEIQRRKGTARSVRQIIEAFGGQVVLREWWQTEPRGQPHTFDMVLNLSGQGGETATAQYVEDVIAEVSRTKPVRSHFSFTQGVQAGGHVAAVPVARVITYRRMQFAAA